MPQTIKVSDFRTQVYFPQYLYRRAKQYAAARKVSFATVIREAVAEKFDTKAKTQTNDLLDLAGSLKGEPADFSVNIAKYIKQMYQEKTP